MDELTDLQKVIKIENGEVKPIANFRSIFNDIFPEVMPPVLRSYKAYLIEAATLKITPLTEAEWQQCVGLT